MGFLDNLLKREARKIIANVVDNVVDNALDSINGSAKSTSSVKSTTVATPSNPDEDDCCYEQAVVCDRIERIAASEWSGYELRKNISASELGADNNARDYSYGLYLNGVPKAMIIIIDIPSHYKKKDVLLAHEACERQGIFCMNLLLHLPNRYSYISKRLSDHVAR